MSIEVALIPPIALQRYAFGAKYSLILPQLLRNQGYMLAARFQHTVEQVYGVLDNGAAEKEQMSQAQLLRFATVDPVASEMAIPDTLGDRERTLKQLDSFMEKHRGYAWQVSLGVVLQGSSVEDAVKCFEQANNKYGNLIRTWYVPRLLVKKDNYEARLQVVRAVREQDQANSIHLFGASSLWPDEVRKAASLQSALQIRSIDTSLPFVAAWHGIDLELECTQTALLSRPEGYFDLTADDFDMGLVDHNVEVYKAWANNGYRPTDS